MNPLELFAQYKRIFEGLALLALVLSIGFGIHRFLEHEREIGRNEVRAEYQQKLLEATQAAKAKEEADAKRLQEAQNALSQANETIRSLSTSNAKLSSSLRDTANSINNRLPSLPINALRDLAKTYGDIFTECQTRRGELAEEAERLNAEKRALIDAWPR
jgi:chromosome segregation ATPase